MYYKASEHSYSAEYRVSATYVPQSPVPAVEVALDEEVAETVRAPDQTSVATAVAVEHSQRYSRKLGLTRLR